MCGIFGAIGAYNPDKTKLLAILNESRGKDSYGLWDGENIWKGLGAISNSLDSKIYERKKMILGHTRYKTTGKISKDNAHPFQAGRIIGAHNGQVYNFDELQKKHGTNFEVDSQVIFWGLNKFGHSFLKELNSYWGLWWIDLKTPHLVHLMAHENTLAFAREGNAFYFSSDAAHLRAAGLTPTAFLEDRLYSFDIQKMKLNKKDVKGLKDAFGFRDWKTTGNWESWKEEDDGSYIYFSSEKSEEEKKWDRLEELERRMDNQTITHDEEVELCNLYATLT